MKSGAVVAAVTPASPKRPTCRRHGFAAREIGSGMVQSATTQAARRWRTLFLSDLHLGSPACRSQALLQFLDGVSCERLYLVGDIVDGLRLQRRWFWPAAHAAVLERLAAMSQAGTLVTYVPGNHDSFACSLHGAGFLQAKVTAEAEHRSADGLRWLVAHGDAYDPRAGQGALPALAGDWLYRGLLRLDRAWRWGQRRLGARETSLAAGLKRRSPLAARVVAAFETALGAHAARLGYDGVVCGHIHSPGEGERGGVRYLNCGDWVESCTAVAEDAGGRLQVLSWTEAPVRAARLRTRPTLAPSPACAA